MKTTILNCWRWLFGKRYQASCQMLIPPGKDWKIAASPIFRAGGLFNRFRRRRMYLTIDLATEPDYSAAVRVRSRGKGQEFEITDLIIYRGGQAVDLNPPCQP